MRVLNKSFFLAAILCSNFSLAQTVKKDTVKNILKSTQALKEILVTTTNPISEKFSVIKLNKLNIYFNPASNGDPLKAITILPSSTNTDETANPTLRGGAADRSRVFINGSPVLNPVRNGQDNGLGNFSLFNTELIDFQYVYASNPPLTYGNSSAGIVEIETNKKLEQEDLQVSLALSNVGILLNKKISKTSFIQLYGNHQFSNAFLALNKNDLPNLNYFSTNDLGLNARFNLNDHAHLNTYSYLINEGYGAHNYLLNYDGNSTAKRNRFFTINNYDYTKSKSVFKISTLIDYSNQFYDFGIINSDTKNLQFFSTLSHKFYINNALIFQYGADYSVTKYTYQELRPVYYFSIENGAKSYLNDEGKTYQNLEPYAYINYNLSSDFGLSTAIRKNIPLERQTNFTSYQLSTHYEINRHNRFILSAGSYHSYSTPNYISHEVSLLSSYQAALDYYYSVKRFRLTSALYSKSDGGNFVLSEIESFNKVKTLGFETSLNYDFTKQFSLGVSNSYLHQIVFSNAQEYKGNSNLKYFIKSQLLYSNPKILTASLAYSMRPGSLYTNITDATFNINANTFEPILGTYNNASFNSYSRLDFTMNKGFLIKKNGLVAYFSINNVFNKNNKATINYNSNYTNSYFNYYQKRIIYFGIQYRLYHLLK